MHHSKRRIGVSRNTNCCLRCSSVIRVAMLLLIAGSVRGSAAAHGGGSKGTESRPSILYIFTDDQSRRSVSAYEQAHEWVETPHIDALAESGMRFTTCYTGASCQMSRAMMLTGRLQHAIRGVDTSRYPACDYDPEVQPFWPSNFRRNGYQTACIGKWHLGEDVGHGRDWDYSAVWDRCGPRSNRHAYYHNTLVRYNGGERVPLDGYSTDRYTDLAVDYLKNAANENGRPWFLWLCYGGVHGPYTPADRDTTLYQQSPPAAVPGDIFGPRPTKPRHMVNYTQWEKDEAGEPRDFDQKVKKYHRAVHALDDGVGRIVQTLADTGQLQNTLIVFTSDQGFAWGQHGSREKWLAYDANIAAPLIMSWPAHIQQTQVCNEPVTGLDVVRTFHAVADVAPADAMDGRDMSRLLTKPSSTLQNPLLLIHTARLYGTNFTQQLRAGAFVGKNTKPAWLMIRDGAYKYIRHMQSQTIEELYDLQSDPNELTNLAVSESYAAVLRKLRSEAETEFRRHDGDFVDLLPSPRESFR